MLQTVQYVKKNDNISLIQRVSNGTDNTDQIQPTMADAGDRVRFCHDDARSSFSRRTNQVLISQVQCDTARLYMKLCYKTKRKFSVYINQHYREVIRLKYLTSPNTYLFLKCPFSKI